jgi:putative membrane protein
MEKTMRLFGRKSSVGTMFYSGFNTEDMILRDHLAADRTTLSNQNTFLAYIRTALTLFVAGVTFVRFFETPVVEIIGWIFIPIGALTFLVGLIRYNRLRVALQGLRRRRT